MAVAHATVQLLKMLVLEVMRVQLLRVLVLEVPRVQLLRVLVVLHLLNAHRRLRPPH